MCSRLIKSSDDQVKILKEFIKKEVLTNEEIPGLINIIEHVVVVRAYQGG